MSRREATPEDRAFIRAMQAQQSDRDERKRAGEAAYKALKTQGKLASHRLIAYRCSRRCLLIDVVQFPEPVGVIVHQPRYRLSPELNAASSSESGRAKNTEDGDRRWREQFMVPETMLNVTATCDHLAQIAVSKERMQRDVDAGLREVIVTPEDHEPARLV